MMFIIAKKNFLKAGKIWKFLQDTRWVLNQPSHTVRQEGVEEESHNCVNIGESAVGAGGKIGKFMK